MKVSLIIPFIDEPEVTKHCLETACKNAGSDFELLLIDNGSDKNYLPEFQKVIGKKPRILQIRNLTNIGVLLTFKQGFMASGDIIGFIHNDVLLHEENWVQKVSDAFEGNPHLGLVGIFGALGVGNNGGRVRPQSNMLGLEWGKCECHPVAWQHHSEYIEHLAPATILDGVGMFFSRDAAQELIRTDMFDSWRAPHHFYDRIIPLKLIDKGFLVGTLPLGFDHWSGATANSSEKYAETGKAWLESQNTYNPAEPVDKQIYDIAERQFFDEFGARIPCSVDQAWNYTWQGVV